MPTASSSTRIDALLREADQCVKCGLCLPHCPTYRLSGDEGDSPRGRIALLQGVARDELEPTPTLTGHLDRCLACRACEAVCPAKVQFGHLLDLGRSELAHRRAPARGGLGWLLRRLATSRAAQRALARLIRLYRGVALDRLARRSGLLKWLGLERREALAGDLPPVQIWRARYPARGAARGEVSLFIGCVANALDQRTISAAIEVLTWLGFEVHVPPSQTCCGALFAHEGDLETAARLANANLTTFPRRPLLFLASGCGAQLLEYPQLLGDATARLPAQELCAFLNAHWPADLTLPPSDDEAVLVHEPCTHRNIVRGTQDAYDLLHRLPGLTVAPLPDNASCCGAAGSYLLRHPEIADTLRTPKLAAAAALRPRYLATTNIGCALHLAAGLRAQGTPVEVVHPVELLARRLAVE